MITPTPDVEVKAAIERLKEERDEARNIARVFAEHWPYGHLARDEALRNALCAVPAPSARSLSTPKGSDEA